MQLGGLMTIGKEGDISAFERLKALKEAVSQGLQVDLELSMGMSGDFEAAIQAGSTNVRVGSLIFGSR